MPDRLQTFASSAVPGSSAAEDEVLEEGFLHVHRLLRASSIGRALPARLLRGASLVDLSITPTE